MFRQLMIAVIAGTQIASGAARSGLQMCIHPNGDVRVEPVLGCCGPESEPAAYRAHRDGSDGDADIDESECAGCTDYALAAGAPQMAGGDDARGLPAAAPADFATLPAPPRDAAPPSRARLAGLPPPAALAHLRTVILLT